MITVERPDPSWLISIQERRAVLWLGPNSIRWLQGARGVSNLRRLIEKPWSAVVIDAPPIPVKDAISDERVRSLVLRVFENDAGPSRLPPNRLPIYVLRGSTGTVLAGHGSDPAGLFNRLTMLKRVPVGHDVFVIGRGATEGNGGLLEAQRVSSAFERLILVEEDGLGTEELETSSEMLVLWRAAFADFLQFVETTEITGRPEQQVLVRTPHGVDLVDLAPAIDASYPITSSFEIVPGAASTSARDATLDDLNTLLADPAASWTPYSASVPYDRSAEYLKDLERLLEHCVRDGPSATTTAWLHAEDGSGASTLLRQIALGIARRGFPALVARPNVDKLDFGQLSGFLTRASELMSTLAASTSDLPWLLVFDAEQVQLHREFVSGVASGLKNLLRSAVVLAVRPLSMGNEELRVTAHGSNHTLGSPLRNSVTSDEALAIGEHLSSFLPPEARRQPEDWTKFARDAIQIGIEGRVSLFWVALRFWLFQIPAAGESLRSWLDSKVKQTVGDKPEAYAALLEVASFSRYRLALPAELLPPNAHAFLRLLSRDQTNALGIRRIARGPADGFAYSHPLIAEELLRLSSSNPEALASVDKATCLNLQDLELHLFARIVQRPAAGNEESVPILEELVVNGLRVDPRAAPRNYVARDRIVELLEAAPDSLWDSSQIFNHHLAKARRHLAIDPPDPRWTLAARIEQVALAENHLLDALDYIHVDDPERKESELNLRVSLALTYDVRARLETDSGNRDTADQYRGKSERMYASAQRINADNSYVLENFARFKISLARVTDAEDERLRLLIEAISLLEWERVVDEGKFRDEPVLTELGRALEILRRQSGVSLLTDLAESGSENAAVALAVLVLSDDNDQPRDAALAQAEQVLLRINPRNATWRSQHALYQVVSELRPYDFAARLDLLESLSAQHDFAWPLQRSLEYGILLYQAGDVTERRNGKDIFRIVREQLKERSVNPRVPNELRFLADPRKDFRDRLLTRMRVKNVSNVGRNYFAIPEGWYDVDVPFRPYLFGQDIRVGDERDCFIQFTNFGPQAVPSTTP